MSNTPTQAQRVTSRRDEIVVMVRTPAVAGLFYGGTEIECRGQVDACLAGRSDSPPIAGRIVGGVVPHAGYVCSGSVTASVFAAIAERSKPVTIVIMGAVHHPGVRTASLFARGKWETPLGVVDVDDRLADRILSNTNLIADDAYSHEQEHSIEVQVPFIQRLLPESKILPILVMPGPRAVEVGDAVGRTLTNYNCDAVVVASSDLTHYGDRYGFLPKGEGPQGLTWAKEVNDRRAIDRMLNLDAEGMVAEAKERHNACGPGAIAATMAAARHLGADHGVLLAHTTSRDVLGPESGDCSVGYAGVVFASRE